MEEREKELIREYKLLQEQAVDYLADNDTDKFFDCIDQMRIVETSYYRLRSKRKKLYRIVSVN